MSLPRDVAKSRAAAPSPAPAMHTKPGATRPRATTKRMLSPSGQRLVNLMQRVNFGSLHGLKIRGGEPILDPLPRIVHHIKIGAKNGPRTETALKDFQLKSEVIELFEHFARFDNANVVELEIGYGIPTRLRVEENAAQ